MLILKKFGFQGPIQTCEFVRENYSFLDANVSRGGGNVVNGNLDRRHPAFL